MQANLNTSSRSSASSAVVIPMAEGAMDDLWREHFAAALRSNEKLPPGDGWLSMKEIKANMSASGNPIGRGRIQKWLRGQLKADTMEQFIGRVFSETRKNERVRNVWYRPKALPVGGKAEQTSGGK